MNAPAQTPRLYDLSTALGRARARVYLSLVDHGFLRHGWTNLDEIAPGVWRSNQPDERRIARHARQGIRTIISLRGQSDLPPHLLEEAACRRHGIDLHVVGLSARGLVPRERLLRLLDLFASVERPFLMHCKSGADRAGLASFLYLLAETDTPPEAARGMLSFRYLHLNDRRTGILDHMAEAFLADRRATGIGIRDWITGSYDPVALTLAYRRKRGLA